MIRALIELLLTLVVIYFVRSVIGIILRSMGGPFTSYTQQQATSGASQGSRQAGTQSRASELKKDPVCGTFVSAQSSLQKTVRGETYYFCSPECRNKFPG